MTSVNDVLIAAAALAFTFACKRWPPPRSVPVAEPLAISSALAAAVRGDWFVALVGVLAFAAAMSFRIMPDLRHTATDRSPDALVFASIVGLLAASWIDHRAVTVALFAVAFARRHFTLVAVGLFFPMIVLSSANISNGAAIGALTVLTCTLMLAGRPTQPTGIPIAVGAFSSLLVMQIAPAFAESGDFRWLLGAAIAPASTVMLLAAGGRGLNAERVSDVVSALSAAFAATCFASVSLVAAGQADDWPAYTAIVGGVASLLAAALLGMSASSDATLEMLAGAGHRQPVAMTLFSIALLGCLPFLPLTAGWLWLEALRDTFHSTRLDPQPALLLLLIAIAGPTVVVPTVGNALVTIWLSESKGVPERLGVARLLMGAACVLAAPAIFVATLWTGAGGLPQ